MQNVQSSGGENSEYKQCKIDTSGRVDLLNAHCHEQVAAIVEDKHCYTLYLRLCTLTDVSLTLRLHVPRFRCQLKPFTAPVHWVSGLWPFLKPLPTTEAIAAVKAILYFEIIYHLVYMYTVC